MSGLGWTILGTIAGLLGLFATLFFGIRSKKKHDTNNKHQDDQSNPLPEESDDKVVNDDKIVITSIQRFDTDTLVVNLEYKGVSSWAKNLTVKVSKNDMCRLENSDDFPKEVRKDGSFVVKLSRYKFNDDTRFSVVWDDWDGNHDEVKTIDFNKCIEIKSNNYTAPWI